MSVTPEEALRALVEKHLTGETDWSRLSKRKLRAMCQQDTSDDLSEPTSKARFGALVDEVLRERRAALSEHLRLRAILKRIRAPRPSQTGDRAELEQLRRRVQRALGTTAPKRDWYKSYCQEKALEGMDPANVIESKRRRT